MSASGGLGEDRLRFPSRRSAVVGIRSAVASSQPLAVQAGIATLTAGGNAADAAVATAAVLSVVEPMSTGLGGDAFALVFDSRSGTVSTLNSSGRAPQRASLDTWASLGLQRIPEIGILSVLVPGVVDSWANLLTRYGTMSLADVLTPAIAYAEDGFPISEVVSRDWHRAAPKLKIYPSTAKTYLYNGRPPKPGEIIRQPDLANTLRLIARGGRDEFYLGEVAERIVACSQASNGLLTKEDLRDYSSQWISPISTTYRGFLVCEVPPNSIGVAVLIALNILEDYDIGSMVYHSSDHLHVLIEAVKLSMADALTHVSDPDETEFDPAWLLSKQYASERRRSIDKEASSRMTDIGHRPGGTVYITVVDSNRNAVSLSNSLFDDFGSGVIVEGTGVVLNNRASLFSLDSQHSNCIAPGKRSLHTLCPSMVIQEKDLFMSFGVMGGMMQPQGQLMVFSNIVDFGMDPQTALDAPRFRYLDGRRVAVEHEIPHSVRSDLSDRGHEIILGAGVSFGGGQAIMVDGSTGVLVAGSDPRKDGCAMAL